MNALNLICVVLLTLLLSMTLFSSSVEIFFSRDELHEMGIRIDPFEIEKEAAAACYPSCPSG